VGTGHHTGLAGAKVVFLNLGIEVLAGEHEGIVERPAGVYDFAEWLIRVVLCDNRRRIHYQPDAAQSIVEIEIAAGCMIASVLGQYLAVGPQGICDPRGSSTKIYFFFKELSERSKCINITGRLPVMSTSPKASTMYFCFT